MDEISKKEAWEKLLRRIESIEGNDRLSRFARMLHKKAFVTDAMTAVDVLRDTALASQYTDEEYEMIDELLSETVDSSWRLVGFILDRSERSGTPVIMKTEKPLIGIF